jgi:predicted PurR-regulated permease PerM
VFLCLWFGGWLWGIAGVALAVPLLVATKALGLGLGGNPSPRQPGREAVGLERAELLRP